MGKSLIKDPEVVDFIKNQMNGGENSPVLSRAPLLLSESLLFPYEEGLSFVQDVWMDQGQKAPLLSGPSTGRRPRPGRSSTPANSKRRNCRSCP